MGGVADRLKMAGLRPSAKGRKRPTPVLIEAIRQVRGECGKRQVNDCDIALAHGNGGVLSSQCMVIFGSEATL